MSFVSPSRVSIRREICCRRSDHGYPLSRNKRQAAPGQSSSDKPCGYHETRSALLTPFVPSRHRFGGWLLRRSDAPVQDRLRSLGAKRKRLPLFRNGGMTRFMRPLQVLDEPHCVRHCLVRPPSWLSVHPQPPAYRRDGRRGSIPSPNTWATSPRRGWASIRRIDSKGVPGPAGRVELQSCRGCATRTGFGHRGRRFPRRCHFLSNDVLRLRRVSPDCIRRAGEPDPSAEFRRSPRHGNR